MSNVNILGYTGQSISTAFKVAPHLKARDIDHQHFVTLVAETLNDLMPNKPAMSAGVSVSADSFTPLAGAGISGAGYSR